MSSEEQSTPGGDRLENVTLGGPHPGLNTFCHNDSLKYFNKESILREELADCDTEMYFEDQNISLAIGKIYLLKSALAQQLSENRSRPDSNFNDEANLRENNNRTPRKKKAFNGDPASTHTQHSLLVRRLRHDLSLGESEEDSSFCVMLNSPESGSPGNTQGRRPTRSRQGAEDLLCSQQTDHGDSPRACLGPLLRLMSILPQPMASYCKQVMDKDNFAWKISLYDVISVFLNWGATLESLHLGDILGSSETEFFPRLPFPSSDDKTSEGVFPDPSNVRLVLSAMIERLPEEKEATASPIKRSVFLRVLMLAALDTQHQYRQNLRLYCSLICALLDSFHPWDEEKATALVNHLGLECLDIQNAEFVCCSVFSLLNPRQNLVGLLACHNVLLHQFGLPSEPSLSLLVDELAPPDDLLERFSPKEIYVMTQLLHSLLIRHTSRIPLCPQEVVVKLHLWTMDVRSILNQVPYKFDFLSGFVRERICRLSSECMAIVRRVYKDSISSCFNFNTSIEDSPSK